MTDPVQLTYSPGRWVALATIDNWLLVDLAAEDPVVRRCWKLMSEHAGVDMVLDALLEPGVALCPGFVLVSLRNDEPRAVCRYPGALVLHRRDDDGREIAGDEGVSWVDVRLDGELFDAITLRGPQSGSNSVDLPMGTGVTTAGIVHVTTGARATPTESASTATTEPELARTAEMQQPTPSIVSPIASVTDDQGSPSYDFLFGATVRPTDVPSRIVDAHAETLVPSGTVLPTSVDDPGEGPAQSEVEIVSGADSQLIDTRAAEPRDEGLIDAVPGFAAVVPPPALHVAAVTHPSEPEVEPLEADSDVDGAMATVNRAQLRASIATSGVQVLAGYCANHHLSAPHAPRCRVCSAPMPHQEPFEIPRPALGVLRLHTGEVISLDRGVILGRSPEAAPSAGNERPNLLRLASPENDISRNHAEIVLDGWNVYLRDTGSVNGTVVRLPGRAPERLRDNDPHLLESGAVITLADEISLTFEVTA